jgi:tRNA threonylcarbamoyladenosine biosynthesis protein TsaE
MSSEFVVVDGDAMRALAREVVAPLVRAGDLLILTGDLGAGKTTFTQGLGAALGVRGPIASPTFIIARTHPSLVDGPSLIHVDAYRLSGLAELDDLDLDATLEDSVTVVEWGDQAAALADDRLHVVISRARGGEIDPEAPDGGDRIVSLDGHGARWDGAVFDSHRAFGTADLGRRA